MRHSIFLTIVSTILLAGNAKCQQIPDQNKWYYIRLDENKEYLKQAFIPVDANKLFGVTTNSPCLLTSQLSGDTAAFLWKFIRVGAVGNTYMIVNKKGNQYMDVHEGSIKRGTRIIWHSNNGQPNQQFRLIAAGNNAFYISSQSSGLVLSRTGLTEEYFETHVGVPATELPQSTPMVKQLGLTGEKNQVWTLTEPLPVKEIKKMTTITGNSSNQTIKL